MTGSEDILIQGQVDGSVTLAQRAIGVGTEGHVKAKITGKVITIEGKVERAISPHWSRSFYVDRLTYKETSRLHEWSSRTAPPSLASSTWSARDADAETGHTAATDASAVDAKAESPAQLDTKPGPTSSGSAGAYRWSKPSFPSSGRPTQGKSESSGVDGAGA